MTNSFDQHEMNHMIVAISREMTPVAGKRHSDADTLFIGGAQPSEAQEHQLAMFGQNKNYKIIFPSFDLGNLTDGPIGIHAVVTDGLADTVVLRNGRLWKRDRRSTAILLFPDLGIALKLSSKGRLIVRGMAGQYHDQGYDLAREAVLARAGGKPGHAPVVSAIGSMVTVFDIRTMADTFAAAA